MREVGVRDPFRADATPHAHAVDHGAPLPVLAFALLDDRSVKYALLPLVALACTACGGASTSVLPSPTTIVTAANTVCGVQIAALDLHVDYAGPHLVVGVRFAGDPAPVDIEIERYLADGRTELVRTLAGVHGQVRVALAFNTTYRGRARGGSCAWSPWFDHAIGPPNPCGDCAAGPPVPAPLPDPGPDETGSPDDGDPGGDDGPDGSDPGDEDDGGLPCLTGRPGPAPVGVNGLGVRGMACGG